MSADHFVEIFVPCEVFELEVEVAPREGLSALESLTLEALRSGSGTIEDLVHLFKIGHRPMLDLISDLWRQGYVYVDFVDGRIAPVEHRLGKNGDSKLVGGERSLKHVALMQDLLTGHILPVLRSLQIAPNNKIAPQVLAYGSFRHALPQPRLGGDMEEGAAQQERDRQRERQADLFEALEQVVSRWGEGAEPLHVRNVSLSATHLTSNRVGQRRLLELRGSCAFSASGRLEMKVVHPPSLGRRLRRAVEACISELAAERPDEPFFKYLCEHAGGGPFDLTPPLEVVAERFTGRLEDLAGQPLDRLTEPLAVNRLQDDLARTAELLQESLEQRQAERVALRLLAGRKAIDDAIRSAIGDARQQVVLGCPTVRWSGFERYLQSLSRAVERGVSVFVLWGTRSEDALESTVRNAFSDLERRGSFRWARYPARSNARFCLRDFDRGVFTTIPFLDHTDATRPALGVQVRAREGTGSCRPILAQLERVYRIFPDYGIAATLRIQDSSPRAAARFERPAIPQPAAYEGSEAVYLTAVLRTWREAWVAFGGLLEASFDEIGDTAALVHDSAHRDVLLEALAESRRLVVVGSESASSEAFDPRLEQAIQGCAGRGVRVLLLYNRIRPQDDPVRARIDRLVESNPGRVVAIATSCSGGFLVADDRLLVSGFEFLAQRGRSEAADRHRTHLETGLMVRSAALGSAAVDLVTEDVPGARGVLSQCTPRDLQRPEQASPDPRDAALRSSQLVERRRKLWEHLSALSPSTPRKQASELRLWIEETVGLGSGEEDIEVLIQSLPESERLVAVSNYLRSATTLPLAQRQRWLAWIASDRWHREAWHEAAVVLLTLDDAAPALELPPIWLAELAAARLDRAWLTELLGLALVRDDASELVAAASACIAIPALILEGVNEAWMLLERWESLLPQAIQAWSRSVRRYWMTEGREIPSLLLLQREGTRIASDRARRTSEELLAIFDDAAKVGFAFGLGRKTWARMFHPHGDVGRLRPGIQAGDVDAVRSWLESNRARRMGPEELLDKAAREVWQSDPEMRDDRIERKKRRECLHKLGAVFASAEDWLHAAASTRGGKLFEVRLKPTLDLTYRLREAYPAVQALETIWSAERCVPAPLARRMLRDLDLLMRADR